MPCPGPRASADRVQPAPGSTPRDERVSTGAAPPRSEASQTLDRGIRILESLAARGDSAGLTVTELATALGVGRPVVYRLVTTLEAHHLVARADDGRVRLALGISRLA